MTQPIIDAHMHLWDLKNHRYPWLQERKREMWIGDFSSLQRDFLIQDYLAAIKGLGIVKSVHLQAQWDHADPIGETRWLQGIADEHEFPHGIVGFCQLNADNAEAVIEQHCELRGVRGIRHDINWHPDPLYSFCDRADYLQDAAWRRGLARLQRHGLSFDLQIYAAHQGDDAYQLVKDFPGIQFILDHSGAPYDRTPAGRDHWQRKLRRLAELPNLVTKLSGFDMFDHQWTLATLREPMLRVLDAFGPERCLFASNTPVSGLYAPLGRLIGAYREILSTLTDGEQRMVFHDNAARIYRV
ncbi:MAG: amidohydrolase family protein [Kofleriaceae bacterium]